MNDITIFSNEEFGKVREITIDGDPWFVGKDVADALGYSNSRDALAKHVDAEDKNTVAFRDGTAGNPMQTVINESGMYSLIFGSKLDSAKRFKRWVTHDVLPSIRKTGSYSVSTETMMEKINKLENMVAELAKSLAAPRESVQVSQVAYMLQNKGIDIGRNNFIKFLRDNGYMIKNENRINVATKRSLDEGLMELKEKEVMVRGNNFMNIQTFITPKGQDYFLKLFGAK